MLAEYGICMSLVRSTSAALYVCDDVCSLESSASPRKSQSTETMVHRNDTVGDGSLRPTGHGKQLTTNDIVDTLCYVCYLPLFFAGPLMTFENFRRQVSTLNSLTLSVFTNFFAFEQIVVERH